MTATPTEACLIDLPARRPRRCRRVASELWQARNAVGAAGCGTADTLPYAAELTSCFYSGTSLYEYTTHMQLVTTLQLVAELVATVKRYVQGRPGHSAAVQLCADTASRCRGGTYHVTCMAEGRRGAAGRGRRTTNCTNSGRATGAGDCGP